MPSIPENTRQALSLWTKRGLPHPSDMGSFVRAVLTNDLRGALGYADEANAAAMREIVSFVHCDVPTAAHGSIERLKSWHDRHRDLDAHQHREVG